MFALICVLTILIICCAAWYLGDYYGKQDAKEREADRKEQIIKEQAQKIKDQEEIIKAKEQKLKEKTTTLYPCGARAINEKGETIDILERDEAVLMHFLLAHQDKIMSTVELSDATHISHYLVMKIASLLYGKEWVFPVRNADDYYIKVLLTDEGKKIFLEAF